MTPSIPLDYTAGSRRSQRQLPRVVRLVAASPVVCFSVLVLSVAAVMAAFGPSLAPYHFNEIDAAARLQGPSLDHWLGTDELGRDLLSRVIYGARVSVVVALGAVAISAAVALVVGMLSGYAGGVADAVIQRLVDAWMAFPTILMALTVLALFGSSTLNVTVTVGLLLGIGQSRVIRGLVLGMKEGDWVIAAKVIGCPPSRVLARHILPNVIPLLVTLTTLSLGQAILTEASLAFLGFGAPPPQPTWGGMLSGSGLLYMLNNPWIAVWPGIALAAVVFSANIAGDFLRDYLDPALR